MKLQDELKQLAILEEMLKTLKYIERNLRGPIGKPAAVFEFETYIIKPNGDQIKGENMNLQLGENALIKLVAIKDAAGNPAKVEGDLLTWSVSGDLSLGDLEVAADGLSAIFKRNGAIGTCTVEVKGDADLGPDVKEIVGKVEIACLGGEAVVFELEATAVPA